MPALAVHERCNAPIFLVEKPNEPGGSCEMHKNHESSIHGCYVDGVWRIMKYDENTLGYHLGFPKK